MLDFNDDTIPSELNLKSMSAEDLEREQVHIVKFYDDKDSS